MAKKKDNSKTWIIGLLALAILFYGGEHGWFGQTIINEGDTVNQDITNELNDAPNTGDGSCSLNLVATSVCVGEVETMNIQEGANEDCLLYFKYESNDWKFAEVYRTDANGNLVISRAPEYAGTYRFVAICGDCVTNFDTIEAIDCVDPVDDGEDDVPIVCGGIWNPSQDTCTEGVCSGDEVCGYVPATLVAPAKCECKPPVDECGPFEETVTHGGYVGATDELLRTPTTIIDFYQGSTYYFRNSDFLIDGSSIDWSPMGAEPAPGSTYTIIYYICD